MGRLPSPQDEVRLIHNLEHGTIVTTWYQPDSWSPGRPLSYAHFRRVRVRAGCVGTTETAGRLGAYVTPQSESQLTHNLEHGGIVIWYDPEALDHAQVSELTSYAESNVASGLSGRFKFILTPWGGSEPLGGSVAVTSWRHILTLDAFDMSAIRAFADANYLRDVPEPNGDPGPA